MDRLGKYHGTMRKENYKTLFDLFHTKIKDPEERVNILVREFNMPEQCRNMQYKDIQRIIIQSLDKKKSVMLLRPLTCHIPVSPGLVARRAR